MELEKTDRDNPILGNPIYPYPRQVKVESEKVGLKLNIQKTKIMASGPITSWEIEIGRAHV